MARKRLGLSQLQLALEADVSVRTIQFAEAGKEELTARTMLQIADALDLTYAEAACNDEALVEDHFDRLPWSMSRFIQRRTAPGDSAYCKDEDDARRVIQTMRESWSVHLDNTGSSGEDNMFGAADRKMSEQYAQYEERYLAIWHRQPECLQLAESNGVRNGVSVVLPVTDEAYDRLRAGSITFLEIKAEDILPESQNLVLDSAVEFAGTGSPVWYRITDSLSFAVFSQIAILSHNPMADDFRMVSFGASPLNLKRLTAIGFGDSGNVMPYFEYPIFEFAESNSDEADETYARVSTTAHYAHLFQNLFRSKSRPKRRVVVGALRAYQRVVKPAVVRRKKDVAVA